MNQEKNSSLEERIKPSRIRRIVGIAALAIAVLGGAYSIFNNPEPTVTLSAHSEPDSKEYSKESDDSKNDNNKTKEDDSNKYRFEIDDETLKIYKKNDSDTPDITINLPHEYEAIARRIRWSERIYELPDPKTIKQRAGYLHKGLLKERERFKEISPDDKSLQSLTPEEREAAAKYLNEDFKSRLNRLLELGKPEEQKEDYRINEPQEIF